MRFADKDSDLYKKCLGIVKEAIVCLKETDKCDEMHILACYVRMAQYCRKAGLADELPIDEVEKILLQRINKTITWDRDLWRTCYVCKPYNYSYAVLVSACNEEAVWGRFFYLMCDTRTVPRDLTPRYSSLQL